VKRTRRNGPIWVIIHIYMDKTQGNSLCNYLYLKLAKISCFSFYLLSVFFYKIGEQDSRTGSGGLGTGGRGEAGEKGLGE
jgi:hypothetical protein